MGIKTSQAKNVWVVGFGVKAPKHHKNNTKYIDDFAFVLDQDGNSSFVPWEGLELSDEQIISDAYLLEALSDVHDSSSTSFGLYHLQPASSPEIADFLVQAHILPLLRDLEIIEHGVAQALDRHDFDDSKSALAVNMFFKQRFDAIKKIETRIRHEQAQHRPQKTVRRGRAQMVLTPS